MKQSEIPESMFEQFEAMTMQEDADFKAYGKDVMRSSLDVIGLTDDELCALYNELSCCDCDCYDFETREFDFCKVSHALVEKLKQVL